MACARPWTCWPKGRNRLPMGVARRPCDGWPCHADLRNHFHGRRYFTAGGWRLQLVRGHAPHVPNQAEPFQQPDDAEAGVDFPPKETRLGRMWIMVVVVVPTIAQG